MAMSQGDDRYTERLSLENKRRRAQLEQEKINQREAELALKSQELRNTIAEKEAMDAEMEMALGAPPQGGGYVLPTGGKPTFLLGNETFGPLGDAPLAAANRPGAPALNEMLMTAQGMDNAMPPFSYNPEMEKALLSEKFAAALPDIRSQFGEPIKRDIEKRYARSQEATQKKAKARSGVSPDEERVGMELTQAKIDALKHQEPIEKARFFSDMSRQLSGEISDYLQVMNDPSTPEEIKAQIRPLLIEAMAQRKNYSDSMNALISGLSETKGDGKAAALSGESKPTTPSAVDWMPNEIESIKGVKPEQIVGVNPMNPGQEEGVPDTAKVFVSSGGYKSVLDDVKKWRSSHPKASRAEESAYFQKRLIDAAKTEADERKKKQKADVKSGRRAAMNPLELFASKAVDPSTYFDPVFGTDRPSRGKSDSLLTGLMTQGLLSKPRYEKPYDYRYSLGY